MYEPRPVTEKRCCGLLHTLRSGAKVRTPRRTARTCCCVWRHWRWCCARKAGSPRTLD